MPLPFFMRVLSGAAGLYMPCVTKVLGGSGDYVSRAAAVLHSRALWGSRWGCTAHC